MGSKSKNSTTSGDPPDDTVVRKQQLVDRKNKLLGLVSCIYRFVAYYDLTDHRAPDEIARRAGIDGKVFNLVNTKKYLDYD